MKMLFTSARASRASGSDANLGRGMDTALTVLAFLGIGLLVDTWLGTRPIFTIGLVVFAAVGTFVRMKLVYDATMSRLESERRESARRAA